MSIVTMINEIKDIQPEYIAFVKVGQFYKTYGKDAYIIAYLLEYKVKEEGKTVLCGFPLQSINKVKAYMERQNINYLIVDRRDEYNVEEKEDFKKLNKYNKIYEKSKIYVNNLKRIDAIYNYLINNVKREELKILLRKIEEEIYEEGKI